MHQKRNHFGEARQFSWITLAVLKLISSKTGHPLAILSAASPIQQGKDRREGNAAATFHLLARRSHWKSSLVLLDNMAGTGWAYPTSYAVQPHGDRHSGLHSAPQSGLRAGHPRDAAAASGIVSAAR